MQQAAEFYKVVPTAEQGDRLIDKTAHRMKLALLCRDIGHITLCHIRGRALDPGIEEHQMRVELGDAFGW